MLRIRDVYPGSRRIKKISAPGSGSASKNYGKYSLPLKLFLSSWKYDPDCSSRIRILIFYPSRIPDPGVKKQRILDPQHCFLILFTSGTLGTFFEGLCTEFTIESMAFPPERIRHMTCIGYLTATSDSEEKEVNHPPVAFSACMRRAATNYRSVSSVNAGTRAALILTVASEEFRSRAAPPRT